MTPLGESAHLLDEGRLLDQGRDALGGVYDAAEDSDIDDFAIVEGHADGQALSVTYTGAAWALAIGGITSDATLIRALRLKVASLPAANRELVSYHDAVSRGAIVLTGPSRLTRALPHWFAWSPFAPAVRSRLAAEPT